MQRLLTYLKERFNLWQHTFLIMSFVFSAISYSRLSRGLISFIHWADFLAGFGVVFITFLLMRILDEHKDASNDMEHRKYLPVPRGLVTLEELRKLGFVLLAIQLVLLFTFQIELWWLYLLYNFWLVLMTCEFFVPEWLGKRPLMYMFSHMLIIPLIDLYSSALDWGLSESGLHEGLIWFIAVSFFNGMVLEVGRKIKMPENEEPGIQSYSGALGWRKATFFWMFLLTITFILALVAIDFASLGWASTIILVLCYLATMTPGILFITEPHKKLQIWIEISAGIWTILMYLILGGLPILIKNIQL